MLRVSMPPKVDLPLESLFTNPAGEGFVATVFPHVGNESDAEILFFLCGVETLLT